MARKGKTVQRESSRFQDNNDKGRKQGYNIRKDGKRLLK